MENIMQKVRFLSAIQIIRLNRFCQVQQKGLLTAVLRCAEVVGKKVPFLCLSKDYCFLFILIVRARLFFKNILIIFRFFERA